MLNPSVMAKKFTQNMLIKYLYAETTPSERLEIENAMDSDFNLREEYEMLVQAHNSFPAIAFNPPQNVISNILNFSKFPKAEVSF